MGRLDRVIFLTVGTQLQFDRLVRMVDELAPSLDGKVFAQIGPGTYVPQNMPWQRMLSAASYTEMVQACDTIISHAGVGSVLTAYRYAKPIILVPRRAAFAEHRNDHQMATVSQLAGRTGIHIAETRDQLAALLHRRLKPAVINAESHGNRQELQHFVQKQVEAFL